MKYEVRFSGGEGGMPICECQKPQLTGIPCDHVLAVCCQFRLNSMNYISHYYSVENYVNTWRGNFHYSKSHFLRPVFRSQKVYAPVAESEKRSLIPRSLKALSQILFRWRHRSLNDVIRSLIIYLRPNFIGRSCFLLTSWKGICDGWNRSLIPKNRSPKVTSAFFLYISLFTFLHDISTYNITSNNINKKTNDI